MSRRDRTNFSQSPSDILDTPTGIRVGPESVIKCPKSQSPMFQQALMLFKVSALQSPTGQATVIPQPAALICLGCGRPIQEGDLEQKSGLLANQEKTIEESKEENFENGELEEETPSNKLVTLK